MRIHRLLFANHGVAVYAATIILSGLALALSMPWASRLSELIMQPWHPAPLAFFLMYATMSALVALSMGAVAAPVGGDSRALPAILTVLVRVSFGHFLMLPLIAYSRVLFPNSVTPLIGAASYVFLLSVMMSMLAMLMEVFAAHQGKHSSGRRYSFIVLYSGIPLFGLLAQGGILRFLTLVSPLQSLSCLLSSSASSSQWVFILLLPILTIFTTMFILWRRSQGRLHV
ncbi:hypothetical protein IH601_10170 [Candidatus Bipolaricaulota bacterium]|nr:hypothetical protein [Candidatus Bipolaricaulota bacterium]TFH10325.1 MAG: hypothetical protein E4H08_03845 [Candidatus Atribacteria bacterium]